MDELSEFMILYTIPINISGMVALIGCYSNPCDQEEHLEKLLNIVPDGAGVAYVKKRVQRRLRPKEVEELKLAYRAGARVKDLAQQFRIHRFTVSLIIKTYRRLTT